MTAISPKHIILRGDPITKEAKLKALDVYGVGAILPGMLIERAANGEVTPHATAGGTASAMFAIEAPWRLGAGIDTEYDEDGEAVHFAVCCPGDEMYALLEVGANVAENALLQSNGAGSLEAYSASTPPLNRLVCRALEAVNNSAGSTPARIRIEVI